MEGHALISLWGNDTHEAWARTNLTAFSALKVIVYIENVTTGECARMEELSGKRRMIQRTTIFTCGMIMVHVYVSAGKDNGYNDAVRSKK